MDLHALEFLTQFNAIKLKQTFTTSNDFPFHC